MNDEREGRETPAGGAAVDEEVAPHLLWAWLVIIGASLTMAATAMWVPQGNSSNEGGGAAAAGSRTTLAVLEFQAKNLIGLSVLPGTEELQEAVDQLKTSVAGGDRRPIGAVAALEAFAGFGEDSRADALTFLDEQVSGGGDSPDQLLATIRRAIGDPATLSENEWQWLQAELGWFGELLPALEGGPQAERADVIRESSMRLSMGLIAGVLTLLAAGVVGSVLLFLAIYYSSQQRLQLRFRAPARALSRVMLESFAVYLGTMAAADLIVSASLMLPQQEGWLEQAASWLSLGSLPLAILLAFAWAARRLTACAPGVGLKGFCAALGLHRGRGWFTEFGCGLVGYVAMLPVVAAGLVGTLAVILLSEWFAGGEGGAADETSISHPIVEWMAGGDLRIMLLALFLAAVVAPLFEETMFRGAFHGALRGRWRFWGAGFVSALVFAVVHPQGLLAVPALGAMGFGFAMIREWRSSLIAPMTAHALHNGMLVGAMWLAFGK